MNNEKGKEKIKEEKEKEKETEQEEKAPLRLSAGGAPPPSFFNHSELFEAYNELQRLAREYVHTSFSVY